MKTTRTPSPALVVAILALVIAVGGAAHAATKAAKNSVVSKSVKNNALKGKDVKEGTIKTGDVGDDSLTGTDIDEATLKLPAQTVQGAQGAAGGDLTGAFPNPAIANNAVNSAKVAPDSLTAADLGLSSVGIAELQDNSVTSPEVVNGSLTGADVDDNTVATVDVTNGSLTGADVDDGTIGSADIGTGAVGTDEIANGTVSGTDIDDNGVASADVTDGSLTGTDVGNDTLTASDINESSLPFGRVGRDSTVGVFTTDADIATKTMNVPAGGGLLFIVASARLDSLPGDVGGALIDCKLDINENDIAVTTRTISIPEESTSQCATNWAQSIGPGNQTVNLEVTSLDANERASDPVLQVMFVPFNELGN